MGLRVCRTQALRLPASSAWQRPVPVQSVLRPWKHHARSTVLVRVSSAVKQDQSAPTSLSDLITFESELTSGNSPNLSSGPANSSPLPPLASGMGVADILDPAQEPSERARLLLERANRALDAVKEVLGSDGPSGPSSSSSSSRQLGEVVIRSRGSSGNRFSATSDVPTATRTDFSQDAGKGKKGRGVSIDGGSIGGGGGRGVSSGLGSMAGGSGPPTASTRPETNNDKSWAELLFSGGSAGIGGIGGGGSGPSPPQMQRAAGSEAQGQLMDFAEVETLPFQGFLELRSQEEELAAKARGLELPPLQSVLELTTAFKPPTRGAAIEEDAAAQASTVGRQLADGTGVLPDGTRWEKKSGTNLGPGGYMKQWTMLRGWSEDGELAWEECWWEASDWAGYKELGAVKSGATPTGSAWRETWTEKAYHDPKTLELTIERSAHKWARGPAATGSDEWEEKWGEKHCALGANNKWADKWGKEGNNVWHEKWGEDYNGRGACTKWTDKWAEREHPGGAREQWGDKWLEEFGDGRGVKHGEVWSIGAGGERYNRWWNEEHYGNGQVRKWGDSNTGEYWDQVEHMDTYYNPIPHFGFDLAVRHSPGLWKVPVKPRTAEADDTTGGLGGGLDALDTSRDDASALGPGFDALNGDGWGGGDTPGAGGGGGNDGGGNGSGGGGGIDSF